MENVDGQRDDDGGGGLEGRVLADRYRVARVVSTGANTVLVDAIDIQSGRPVTVKVVRPEFSAAPEFRRKFYKLAEVSHALTHPNIASVSDWGEADLAGEPTLFWTVDALGGGSLRDLLDRGRLLEPGQALVVGLEACRALDAAHQKGLFHTELTPSKMVFGADRRLRVVDFGMARLLAEPAWADASAVPTHVARYASPEQALGLPIDAKTDVYALALVMTEAVTGAVPFAADSTVATLAGRVDKLLPVSADLGALASVLERAGRPESADRFTAAEFGRALVQVAPKLPKPEPIPIVSTGSFDTTAMRRPTDPTGGVERPPPAPGLAGVDGGASLPSAGAVAAAGVVSSGAASVAMSPSPPVSAGSQDLAAGEQPDDSDEAAASRTGPADGEVARTHADEPDEVRSEATTPIDAGMDGDGGVDGDAGLDADGDADAGVDVDADSDAGAEADAVADVATASFVADPSEPAHAAGSGAPADGSSAEDRPAYVEGGVGGRESGEGKPGVSGSDEAASNEVVSSVSDARGDESTGARSSDAASSDDAPAGAIDPAVFPDDRARGDRSGSGGSGGDRDGDRSGGGDQDGTAESGDREPGQDRSGDDDRRGAQTDTTVAPIVSAADDAAESRDPVLYDEESGRRRGPVILLVVLLLAGLAALAYVGTLLVQPKSFEVPVLAGIPNEQALNQIAGNDWTVMVETERSDSFPEPDTVIRTIPGAGIELEEGEPFTLVLSAGPEFRILPEVEGLPFDAALTQLASLGLVGIEGSARDFSETVPVDAVISWQVQGDADASMQAGAQILPGETIVMTLSDGPEPRRVPDLAGQDLEQATATLDGLRLGLSQGEDAFSEDVPVGVIVSQDPAPETSLDRDGIVTVRVSKGPDRIAFPALDGLVYADAEALLIETGFTVGSLLGTTEGAFVEATIGDEDVAVGSLFRRGQAVDLIFL